MGPVPDTRVDFSGGDMATERLTIRQIAGLTGVSRSTVSRVLNAHPNVSPETREHVLQVIRERGFEPHPAARSLASRRSTASEPDQPTQRQDSGSASYK